jgi:hypothetical protein
MARRPGSSIVTYEEHQRRADAAEALFPEMQRKITKARWGRAADGVGDSGLYGDDIVLWSKRQAELLRRMAAGERVDDQIDWPNVIEEIESVGRAELRVVRSALQLARQHKLLMLGWPDAGAVPFRAAEVTSQLADAHEDFRESMRPEIDLASLYRRARLEVDKHKRDEGDPVSPLPDQCPWSLDELLAEGAAATGG